MLEADMISFYYRPELYAIHIQCFPAGSKNSIGLAA